MPTRAGSSADPGARDRSARLVEQHPDGDPCGCVAHQILVDVDAGQASLERGRQDLVDHGRGLSAHLGVDGQEDPADQFVNPSETFRGITLEVWYSRR